MTEYVPVETEGTLKDVDMLPNMLPPYVDVTWVPPKLMITRPENPAPVTETEVPTGPLVGLTATAVSPAFAVGARATEKDSILRTSSTSAALVNPVFKPRMFFKGTLSAPLIGTYPDLTLLRKRLI